MLEKKIQAKSLKELKELIEAQKHLGFFHYAFQHDIRVFDGWFETTLIKFEGLHNYVFDPSSTHKEYVIHRDQL
jgi:hypothetical protein